MPLIFKVKDLPYFIDFPFETGTSCTVAVLSTSNKAEQIEILHRHMSFNQWTGWEQTFNHCVEMINRDCLELTKR